jgi:hypothetical protein
VRTNNYSGGAVPQAVKDTAGDVKARASKVLASSPLHSLLLIIFHRQRS